MSALWRMGPGLLCSTWLITAVAAPLTPSQVQGTGMRSALEGRQVEVEGIVTANLQRGLGGIFLQSEHDDGDPATSEGLFLSGLKGEALPRPGDRLRARGRVLELGGATASLTALSVERWSRLAKSQPLPAERVLEAAPAHGDDWERYEGMRLRIAPPLTVSGADGLARYGELALVFGPRLFHPNEGRRPGPASRRKAADNARRLLLADDGRNRRDPGKITYLPQGLTAASPLRVGSQVADLAGVLDQRYGGYRLQLAAPLRVVAQAPRPAPPLALGDLRIAGFNVLNLFNGDGRGGGFPTERGAASHAQYQLQQAKLVAAVQALRPDLAALMEMENDGDGADSALAQFVAALNAAGPSRDWKGIGGQGGTGPIRLALIYRASRVQPVGKPASLVDGPFAVHSRPPLAQAFRAGQGPVFVLAANHFKSKGGCDEAGDEGDRDRGDGQGCWNATRVASAKRLADWLATDPTASGSELRLIVGDLNAYGEEDPLRLLRRRGYLDAFAGQAERPYSYVYGGEAGRLDHALLSPALASRLRSAHEWHNNADEADFFDYAHAGVADPWRSSDHDPLLLGFELRR